MELSGLMDMAGQAAGKRGETYYREGRVRIVGNDETSVSADVSGSERYRVLLFLRNNRLRYQCDCPVNADGETCCKHVVAVALTVANEPDINEPQATSRTSASTDQTLREYLSSLPAVSLVDMLLDIARDDADVRRRLTFRQQLSGKPDFDQLKKTITSLIGRPRFLDYRRSREYASQVAEIATLLRQVLSGGQPGLCLRLCDHAFERLIKVYEQSDDSSGSIGDAISGIGYIFHDACVAAPADEKPKPARFLQLLMMDGWGFISDFDHAAMLGSQGVALLESAIESAWQKQSAKSAADSSRQPFKLRHLMEQLAERRGDVNLLISIYASGLEYGHAYHQIVKLCLEHGREREAVQWAERSVQAFPKDAQLRQQLAALYKRDGFEQEALEQIWQAFLCAADSRSYLQLREYAGDAWPQWREQALASIVKAECPLSRYSYSRNQDDRPDASLRVSCLLAEGCVEEARVLLQTHGLSDGSRLALARAIFKQHPAEAYAQFKIVIRQTLIHSDNNAYKSAVELLTELRGWLGAEDFASYVETLRTENKARRNFIKLLQSFSAG